MKLNHLIIIGALCGALLLPSSASSWGVVGLSAGGGGGGTLLAGTSVEAVTASLANPNHFRYSKAATLGVAGVVAKGYVYLNNRAVDQTFKQLIYQGDAATGTFTLFGTSDATTVTANSGIGWYEITFTAGPTISASKYYVVGIIGSTYVSTYYTTGFGEDTSGTYSDPPASITVNSLTDRPYGGNYVTN